MNGTAPQLVCVGVATEDAIAVVDRYPAADERIVANDVLFGGGGPAATAAVAAARLGIDVALVAAVGDDDAGAKVIGDLHKEGVDVSGVTTIAGGRTARSVVVISGAERARAISNLPGPTLQLDNDSKAAELIAAARWVHVDQHGWASVRHVLDSMSPASAAPRLSVDAGNTIAGYRQAGTALYAPTTAALIARYGQPDDADDIEQLLRRAISDGAELAVATSGADGSYALARDGNLVRARIPDLPVASTLGAGDVFHGALLAGLLRSEAGELTGGLGEVLAYATTVASLSCRGIDGRSQIPDHRQAMDALADAAAQETKGNNA